MKKNIKNYIDKQSFSHTIRFTKKDICSAQKYDAAVVIPAFAENDYIDSTLYSLSKSINNVSEKILILIVVNNPPARNDNPVLLEHIKNNLKLLNRMQSCFGELNNDTLTLAYIDAASPGNEISDKYGVGGARKIGCDGVLHLLNWEQEPLIFFLDADTVVPENYISSGLKFFKTNKNITGAYYKFKHSQGDTPENEKAIRLYEQYLNHFVEGLKYAKSPYAYHAVGSTIVCKAESYVKAGGMRAKQAGEDFYFLQALCKVGQPPMPIREISECCITPSSRCSFRVPFGTGAKMNELVPKISNFNEAFFYNPKIFDYIRQTVMLTNDSLLIDAPEKWILKLPLPVQEYFKSKNFLKNWKNILKNTPKNKEKIIWAFHIWFDAFKILKFMHFCEKEPFNLYKVSDMPKFEGV